MSISIFLATALLYSSPVLAASPIPFSTATATATATPTPAPPPPSLAVIDPYGINAHQSHHIHQQRHPAPAQFWVGWPKETVTVVRTVTRTGEGSDGLVPIITKTADVTTTMYDSNLPTSGTLTIYTTTTTRIKGGSDNNGGRDNSNGGQGSGDTMTRTRTATVQTHIPQETPWTPADIPRFAECLPGDEDYKVLGVLSLTKEQKNTLIALAIMFVVILVGWNFVLVRYLLYPLKVRYEEIVPDTRGSFFHVPSFLTIYPTHRC